MCIIVGSEQKLNGKVSILSPNWDGIPDELKKQERWLVWKSEGRDGKFTKVPYAAGPATKARTNDPGTWRRYDVAQFIYERHSAKYDGVGIVIKGEMVGIDIDKCRNPQTGELAPLAMEIVALLNSYTEVSPSGTGVKILCQGQVPGKRHRNDNIGISPWSTEIGLEIYDKDSPRFFTVTGHHVEGTPAGIEARSAQIEGLYQRFLRHLEMEGSLKTAAKGPVPENIEQIVAVASNAANGEKFQKLWTGRWEGDYQSQSEADLALVGILAFYCGNDVDLIDSVFRQSGLYRDKWERADYRERTINLAAADECFDWEAWERHKREMERNEALEEIMGGRCSVEFVDLHNEPPSDADTNGKAQRLSPSDLEDLDQGVKAQVGKDKEKQRRGRRGYSIDELESLPPLEWQVEGHFQAGGFNVIFGPPGSAKSFYALDQGLSIATGKKFLGKYATVQGPVAYVCGEGREGLRDRIAAWCKFYGTKPTNFAIIPFTFNLLEKDEVLTLAEIIQEQFTGGDGVRAVYIDTLARMFAGGDENSTKDMSCFVDHVAELGRILGGVTMTTIHHSGKDWTKGGRGSTALQGAADTMISLQGDPSMFVDVCCKKQKNAETFKGYSLQGHRVENSVVLLAEPLWKVKIKNLNEGQRALYDALLKKFASAPFSFAQGFALAEGAKSTYTRRLETLVEQGLVNKFAHDGSYAISDPNLYHSKLLELEKEQQRLAQVGRN